jgi:hypothetical protein
LIQDLFGVFDKTDIAGADDKILAVFTITWGPQSMVRVYLVPRKPHLVD